MPNHQWQHESGVRMTIANPYGTDMAITNQGGILDLEPTMREVSGLPVLAQSLVMRQTTPTGSVIAVPNDCFDVRSWVSKGMTLAEINGLGPRVAVELQKDERVSAATVTSSFTLTTSTLVLTESIQSSLGPFTLTLTLTPSNVSFVVAKQGGQ
jgi:hypothetical protein